MVSCQIKSYPQVNLEYHLRCGILIELVGKSTVAIDFCSSSKIINGSPFVVPERGLIYTGMEIYLP